MPKPDERWSDPEALRLDMPASRADLLEAVRTVLEAVAAVAPTAFYRGKHQDDVANMVAALKQRILGE